MKTEAKSSERLSPTWAVFNGHINDASDRAFLLLDEFSPSLANEVREIEENGGGIMSIFQVPPTPATSAYAWLVTAFVNEDRALEASK